MAVSKRSEAAGKISCIKTREKKTVEEKVSSHSLLSGGIFFWIVADSCRVRQCLLPWVLDGKIRGGCVGPRLVVVGVRFVGLKSLPDVIYIFFWECFCRLWKMGDTHVVVGKRAAWRMSCSFKHAYFFCGFCLFVASCFLYYCLCKRYTRSGIYIVFAVFKMLEIYFTHTFLFAPVLKNDGTVINSATLLLLSVRVFESPGVSFFAIACLDTVYPRII